MASLITAFTYKKKLKFDTDTIGVDTNQANFPVCVHINTSSWTTAAERTAFFGAWNVGGKRCQFFDADGTTNLDYEVELYNSGTPEAIYWVRVPQVDGNSTADYIWVAFGNDPNGTDQDNSEGVWDSSFKLVNHMNYLPLFAQATNLGNASEFSLIMDGSQCDAWFTQSSSSYQTLYYAYATDSDLNSYSTPQSCLTNIQRPFVLKEGSTYYLFAHNSSDPSGDLYLWSSTNKTTWNILNSGNPVLHHDVSGDWKYIWNVGVVVVGSTWHLFAECGPNSDQSDVGIGYSYSTLADMNWDTHKTASHTIDYGGGGPNPVYVPDRNAIILLMAYLPSGVITNYWDIVAYSASTSSDLSLTASWTQCRNFKLSYPAMHTADPHLVVAGDAFDYNIVIAYFYNQAASYQAYIDLSLNDFYDRIQYPIDSTSNQKDGTKRGTFEPAQIAGVVSGGQDFDGSNDYITIPDPFYVTGITVGCWVNMDVVADYKFFINKDKEVAGYREYQFCLDSSKLIFFGWNTANTLGYREGHTVFQAATPYWCEATYDGTTIHLYLNGVEETYDLSVPLSGDLKNSAEPLTLGYRAAGTPNGFLNGKEDEIRISSGARTADWIKLEYYSMKKTNFNGDSWISWDAAIHFVTGAASLSGVGSLTVSGKRILKGTASASGIGSLTVAGQTHTLGVASLSGAGTLSGIANLTASGKAILSGVGNLSASGLSLTTPTAITQPESNVAQTTATINGQISADGGESCEARFRYKESPISTVSGKAFQTFGLMAEHDDVSVYLYSIGYVVYAHIESDAGIKDIALPDDIYNDLIGNIYHASMTDRDTFWIGYNVSGVGIRVNKYTIGESSITLASSTDLGDSYSRIKDLISLTSGKIVVGWNRHQVEAGTMRVYIAYTDSLEAWTTLAYQTVIASNTGIHACLCQHPTDGTIWWFNSNDSVGKIKVIHLVESGETISVDWKNETFITSSDDIEIRPDGEKPFVVATPSASRSAIILGYQRSKERQIISLDPECIEAKPVFVKCYTDGTKALLSYLDEYIERISPFCIGLDDSDDVWIAYGKIDPVEFTWNDLYLNGSYLGEMTTLPSVGIVICNSSHSVVSYMSDSKTYSYPLSEWIETSWQNTLETDDTYHEDLIGLTVDTEYEYQTRAKNSLGEGAWSGSETFITKAIRYGIATLSGTGALIGVANLIAVGQVTLAGIGSLTTLGQRITYGTSALSGVGTLVTAAVATLIGKSTLSGTGSLAAFGELISEENLYEHYNDEEEITGGYSIYGVRWRGQTFTPAMSHYIGSVRLHLYKVGAPLTVTVGIKETDINGHPLGGDYLCSSTFDGSTLGTTGGWKEITFSAPASLVADTKYAIVVSLPSGGVDGRIMWSADALSPTYTGGTSEYSVNSGATWSSTTWDFMFEEWGIGGMLYYGAALLSGAGTLSAIGRGILSGKGTLSGEGTLSGLAVTTLVGQATLAGVGGLGANAVGIFIGKSALEGAGSLTGAGRLTACGIATLSGIGTLATAGYTVSLVSVTLSGVGTLTASAVGILAGKAILSGQGILSIITASGRVIPVSMYLHKRGIPLWLYDRELATLLHDRALSVKIRTQ